MQKQLNDEVALFAAEKVIVQRDTLSILSHGQWACEDKNGKIFSLYGLTDFRVKDNARQKSLEAKKLENDVDTVKLRYAKL